jgi:hypothetical protein
MFQEYIDIPTNDPEKRYWANLSIKHVRERISKDFLGGIMLYSV